MSDNDSATSAVNPFGSTTLAIAGIAGALAVAIGAFGGHGLDRFLESKDWTDDIVVRRIEQFEIGVRYHLAHAVVLLGLAVWQRATASNQLQAVVWLMTVGIVLFSGSLYLLVVTGQTWLGMITPLGGTSWIIAWTMLAVAGLRRPS